MVQAMMKAAHIYSPKDIRIEDAPLPEIASDEVLVQVKVCGVCHVDFELYVGNRSIQKAPVNIGHEAVGVVAAVGQNVETIKKGDRVAVDLLMRCGKCYFCRRGRGNLCINRKGPFLGAFSEYTKAPEENIFKIPPNVSFEEASFTEPLACCINGVEKMDVRKGEDVVIVGAGPMGLLSLQLAKRGGARVIMSDLLDERLKLAKEFGADDFVNPSKEDPVERIRQLTEGQGAEGVMVAIGNIKAMEQGIRMASKCGTVVLFGAIWPPSTLSIDPNLIHYNELVITGAESRTLDQFYRALKMIANGLVEVRPLISHVLPLDKIMEGLEIASNKEGLKVLIKVEENPQA
jgi:L-iditol 2-dehydrogenase